MRQIMTTATAVLLALSLSSAAHAQYPAGSATDRPGPVVNDRDVAVGVAFGSMFSVDPDQTVRPTQWVMSARFGITRHFAIEPEVGTWAFSTTVTWPIGQRTDDTRWTFVGVNALGRIDGRRVSFAAGGGLAYYDYSHRYTESWSGYSNGWGEGTVGWQVLGAVDVRVAPKLAVVGLVRAHLIPEADLVTSGLSAGVRYTF